MGETSVWCKTEDCSWAFGLCVTHYQFLNGILVMHQQPDTSTDKQYLPPTISSSKSKIFHLRYVTMVLRRSQNIVGNFQMIC